MELPLIEFQRPWPQMPELRFSAYLSEDYKWINLTMISGSDSLDQQIQNMPLAPQSVTFKLRSDNPKIESRVFLKIEAVRP